MITVTDSTLGQKKMELNNEKYFTTISLGFLSEIENENYSLTPYLKLFTGIFSENGEKIYLGSKDINLPTSLDNINKELENLIFELENPDYQDEIAY